mmetsp:Transcript_46465/g.122689  ORF Transcript_46465/g.122689 Transcript_46465/m.122689 type:complete len:195 (-) Transcript_46465:28-612(-)
MRPMTQVCCGCSLQFGVQTIVFAHLGWCLMWIWMVTCNIILRIPAMAVGVNRPQQTVNAMWNLAGLPFIIMALWGLWHRVDVQVRLYLHYLVVSFSMHLVLIIYYLFVQDACSLLPSTLKYNGLAFACGVVRGCSIGVLLFTMLVQYYIGYMDNGEKAHTSSKPHSPTTEITQCHKSETFSATGPQSYVGHGRS